MEDKQFEIKVSDLLKSPGKQDTIELKNLIPKELENLTEKGITATLFLQSINHEEILAKLENIYAEFNDICDRCAEDYIRKVESSEFEGRFLVRGDHEQTEEESDSFFQIDPKSEIINIKDMIVQSVLLQEPISKKCPNCIDIDIDEEDYDEYEGSFNGSNINITFEK